MESPDVGAPIVALPERVDRRVRLGPFPSARDALKFASYAAVGAVFAPFVSPFVWVPILGAGFAVSVWRPEGEAVDERAARWAVFHLRRSHGRIVTRRAPAVPTAGSVVRIEDGSEVSVVRTSGTPLAYRPPDDLGTVFDRFRELLRSTEGPIFVRATSSPIRERPVRPSRPAGTEAERAACEGYSELVTALCRRRRTRRVDIVLRAEGGATRAHERLLDRTRALSEQLAGLGLSPVILAARPLADAVHAIGWVPAREAS